jgi:hypothetical protein
MYKLTNVATDHRFAMQRRTAPRLQMEPLIGSMRLRLGKSLLIPDAFFERNKVEIEKHKRHGVLAFEQTVVDDPSKQAVVAVEIVDAPVVGENPVVEVAAAVVETSTPSEPVEVASPAPEVEEKPQLDSRASGKKDKRR